MLRKFNLRNVFLSEFLCRALLWQIAKCSSTLCNPNLTRPPELPTLQRDNALMAATARLKTRAKKKRDTILVLRRAVAAMNVYQLAQFSVVKTPCYILGQQIQVDLLKVLACCFPPHTKRTLQMPMHTLYKKKCPPKIKMRGLHR